MTLEKELHVTLAACRTAGKMAMSYAGRPVKTHLKNGLRDSPVTEADKAIDTYLKDTFTTAFPQDGWLSEESADDESRLTKKRCWVVDPIDGTVGFLHWLENGLTHDDDEQHRRQFSISIALIEDGKPILGAVYAPLRNQLMHAIAGQGLFFNEDAMTREPAPATLADTTYLSSVSETRDGLLTMLEGLMPLQAYGSIAYKMALTAVNKTYITASMKPKNAWDLAAGDLICQEAGLMVTDLAGNPLIYNTKNTLYEGLIVAPPALYPALKDLLPNAPTGGYR